MRNRLGWWAERLDREEKSKKESEELEKEWRTPGPSSQPHIQSQSKEERKIYRKKKHKKLRGKM